MQEGEQESFDFIRAQSADGRRRAAAQGGAASVELLEINKAPRWGEKKDGSKPESTLRYRSCKGTPSYCYWENKHNVQRYNVLEDVFIQVVNKPRSW